MKGLPKLITSIILCLVVGAAGSFFTISSIPTWYSHLNKPFFSPPNYLFGPVWTILYILMGISLYLIWEKGFKKQKSKDALMNFSFQLFFNAIWTPIFFGAKSLGWSLAIIILMLYFIIQTIRSFEKVDKTAAYLLFPYFFWVSFATVLNFSVWLLNK